MRELKRIIVHCSATPPSMDIGAETIRRWHLERGFSDIGYHFVIWRDGYIEPGRPIEKIGAHARGHNSDSIGICLVGGVTEDNKPEFNYTCKQMGALCELINALVEDFDIDQVLGHRDLPGVTKACPSFNAIAFFGS